MPGQGQLHPNGLIEKCQFPHRASLSSGLVPGCRSSRSAQWIVIDANGDGGRRCAEDVFITIIIVIVIIFRPPVSIRFLSAAAGRGGKRALSTGCVASGWWRS